MDLLFEASYNSLFLSPFQGFVLRLCALGLQLMHDEHLSSNLESQICDLSTDYLQNILENGFKESQS